MNKAALLTDLRTQCVRVIENPIPFGGIQSAEGNAEAQARGDSWATFAIERKDKDGKVVQTAYFTGQMNEYKWATVQMAARGVLENRNVHIVVLDEGTPEESASLIGAPIDMPVGDTLTAVAYLEAQKGVSWNAYELIAARADLGFMIIRAWVGDGSGNETEKRFRVTYDAGGQGTHAEIL